MKLEKISLKELTFPCKKEDVRSNRQSLDDEELRKSLKNKYNDKIPFLISKREDNTLFVMDGSRRGGLLKELYGSTFEVSCLIFNGLTEQQEKEIMILASRFRENLDENDIYELLRKGADPVILGKTKLHTKLLNTNNNIIKTIQSEFPVEPNYRRQKREKNTSGVFIPVGSEKKYYTFLDIIEKDNPEKIIILYAESPLKKKKDSEELYFSETGIALNYVKERKVPIILVQGKSEEWKNKMTKDYIKEKKIDNVEALKINTNDYLWNLNGIDYSKGLIYINGADFKSVRPNVIKLLFSKFPFYKIYAVFMDSTLCFKIDSNLKNELIYHYAINHEKKPTSFEEFKKVYPYKLTKMWGKNSEVQNAFVCKIERWC